MKYPSSQAIYIDTEEEFEYVKAGKNHCWIGLRCYGSEAVRGWAFRVGGRPLDITSTYTQHGYSSREEAKSAAIAYIEEAFKHQIREAERLIALSNQFLTEINNLQRQIPSV